MADGSNWTFAAPSHRAGGINAYINDQLSDESIYEDVDKLMKDHNTWHMWMNSYDWIIFLDVLVGVSKCKGKVVM